MKVVFLKDVDGVASGGEVKEVKNGFARNYLIPKNMATPATRNNLLQTKKLQQQSKVTRIKHLEDLRELAEAVDGTVVTIAMRAGANEQLYGSVTGTMLADAVSSITDRNIDRQLVQLDNPIRKLGIFFVPIRLHPEVSASVKVIVHETDTDPESLEENDGEENDVEINGTIVVDSESEEETGDEPAMDEIEDGDKAEENSILKENNP